MAGRFGEVTAQRVSKQISRGQCSSLAGACLMSFSTTCPCAVKLALVLAVTQGGTSKPFRPAASPPDRCVACTMTGGSAGAKRPGGFVLGKGVPQAPPKKVPKAAALIMDDGMLPPPSPTTLALFEKPCDLWVAIDIETHELIPNTELYQGWVTGPFGHQCCLVEEQVSSLRIVQLGWSVGSFSADSSPLTNTFLVAPGGFVISAAATAKHRITNEQAAAEGVPLVTALRDMFSDVVSVDKRDGRICAHQLELWLVTSVSATGRLFSSGPRTGPRCECQEFDAGVILHELRRTGLNDLAETWARIAAAGFCTMNPDVTGWACAELVEHTRHHVSAGRRRTIGLKDMVLALVPAKRRLLERHHDAGADACMDWLVLRELLRHAELARGKGAGAKVAPDV